MNRDLSQRAHEPGSADNQQDVPDCVRGPAALGGNQVAEHERAGAGNRN